MPIHQMPFKNNLNPSIYKNLYTKCHLKKIPLDTMAFYQMPISIIPVSKFPNGPNVMMANAIN
jgi:hypothetical protein